LEQLLQVNVEGDSAQSSWQMVRLFEFFLHNSLGSTRMTPTQSGIRIAVAEDDINLRKTYVAMLQSLGHRVVCAAANGAELLERCFDQDLDLVLVDLDMPVMDGLAVAEEISKKGVPVILISGHPDVCEVVVDQEPIVTRLLKPATVYGLQRAIEEALASSSQ
jgi:two-component system, response regulator PdtaR